MTEIAEALKERDSAFMAEIEKLSQKGVDLADRVADLEQMGAKAVDFSGAPKAPSLQKAIESAINPRDNPLDGKEAEWHQELTEKTGIKLPGAVLYPLQTKSHVDYSTPHFNSPLESAGGSNVVQTDLHRDLIDVLREQSIVMGLGVTMLQAQGDLDLPKKSTDSTAYWFTGDGDESITASQPTFTRVQLRPKFVGALTGFTYRMGVQTGNGIERILANDLMGVLGEEVDRAALQGSGSSSEPTGVLTQSITSVGWDQGTSPQTTPTVFNEADAVYMEKQLIDNKALKGNLSMLCDSAAWLSMQNQYDSEGQPVKFLNRTERMAKLLGYPIQPTTHMAASTVLMGNWLDFVVANWGAIAIAADPYGSNFASGTTSVRAILPIDFAVRHTASFVKAAA